MNSLVFVRTLTAEDRDQLEAGLRSADSFVLRRCQILLASAKGKPPPQIAEFLGCSPQNVRQVIHAFQLEGLDCLQEKPRPPKAVTVGVEASKHDELRALLHQSPRLFGNNTSLWTLSLIAEACYERGLTKQRLSIHGMLITLKRLDINWKRAKHWMTSPDPNYAAKKAQRDRLINLANKNPDWVLGFEDEVWWSRLARPSLNAWTDGLPLKVQLLKGDRDDPDPDAIACYGFLRNDTHKVAVRFVEGRPLADVTIQFVDWTCWNVGKEGKGRLIVVWDDASWHTADAVFSWVREHNRNVKRKGGVKVVICELPVASPWLNNIEPSYQHAKKVILEPDRKLTAQETVTRVCEHFGCKLLPYLKTQVAPDNVDIGCRPSAP
jgi:transposase